MDLLFLPITGNIKIIEELKEEVKEVKEEVKEVKEEVNKPINKNTSYVRKFIENNKEKINLKVQCPICYSSYTYFNKSKHFKTKRHLLLQSIKNNDV